MLENQFIQFSETPVDECTIALPVVFGQEGTQFYYYCNDDDYLHISLIDPITKASLAWKSVECHEGWFVIDLSQMFTKSEISAVMNDGDLFRVHLGIQRSHTEDYSQVLCYRSSMDGLSAIKYSCTPDAFGFPFSIGRPAIVTLPVLLSAPGYSQSDETYTKLDGEIVTLYSQARKEWEGETEYITESLHDKIMVALMCDEVSINGRKVVKSGQYDVEWENYDTLPDGTKTARATFTVQENLVSRNSNY